MKLKRLAWMVVLAATLAACGTTRTVAPVVERTPVPRTASVPKPRPVEAGPGQYVVKRGDTLHKIAQEYNQSLRDLVVWNNLSSPNDIKVDQVLRVAPPDAAPVAAGSQAGGIPPSSGVEVRPLGTSPVPTAPASTSPTVANSANKTWPHGEKRPYSDAALAELQKPDAPPMVQATPVVAAARSDVARNAEKTADKTAEKALESKPVPDSAGTWMWPADGKIVGTFEGGRKGIDIAGKMGQPVLAAGAGTVLYASSVRGYGNLVIVKHSSNLLSAYAHNKAILVKEGQTVTKGQRIAEMGNSDSDTVKLHFEIRQQGKPVDPAKFLPVR
ncbi:peptidoglycan DD-metalloendopeptidase family protein [Noviherbaspirillum pedocola]|uniref:Peptidoglycan DD-metalloendopeptidase family protein n=1 Tax=Noviherbaspirillum pedocola TaxID=2801341 RepID=A0A934SS11_9BURK|nr:peptidoglycan DD-metalloendopeptidase family protein [Noviherbaspirillum pedocola]MBK4734449.1 peptidoglycan DD-metalloendopeptidase family protein [Noviherbaspirillum pedocola]